MKGISKKEIEIVADLEFRKRYYFTRDNVKHHFQNKKQMINILYTLRKKGRIVNLNKNKYFLVPIKARTGKWTDNPLIITDEICDSKDYYISGWYAVHYWHMTDQIPMQVDIYTTRRQGKKKILNMRFVFHRTTKKNIEKKSTIQKIEGHAFRILKKESAEQWVKSRR